MKSHRAKVHLKVITQVLITSFLHFLSSGEEERRMGGSKTTICVRMGADRSNIVPFWVRGESAVIKEKFMPMNAGDGKMGILRS